MRIKTSRVKAYMLSQLQYHIDPRTGEVNSTGLAEDAAAEFELYFADCEIPEDLFDLANAIGSLFEIDTGISAGRREDWLRLERSIPEYLDTDKETQP